jgi:hypothetical protein
MEARLKRAGAVARPHVGEDEDTGPAAALRGYNLPAGWELISTAYSRNAYWKRVVLDDFVNIKIN